MKRILTLLVLAALTALPAASWAGSWDIDTSHSGVTFKVRHFFTKVPGKFTDFGGSIVFDPAKPEAASVQVTINAKSIDTEHEKRDAHLNSEDFFFTEQHPQITFKSTKVAKQGDLFMVDGLLTMRGVEKPVTLSTEFLGAGPDGFGGTRAGFTATTTINRKDFGINWNRTLDQGGVMLGDEVEVTLEIEAVEKQEEGGGW